MKKVLLLIFCLLFYNVAFAEFKGGFYNPDNDNTYLKLNQSTPQTVTASPYITSLTSGYVPYANTSKQLINSGFYWDVATATGSITGILNANPMFTLTNIFTNNNDVGEILRLTSYALTNPTTNFGCALRYYLEDGSGNTPQLAGSISTIWTTATHGSESSAIKFLGVMAGGTLTEFGRFYGPSAGTGGTLEIDTNGLTTTSVTPALILKNATQATSGEILQNSPVLQLVSYGYDGANSIEESGMIYVTPTNISAAGDGQSVTMYFGTKQTSSGTPFYPLAIDSDNGVFINKPSLGETLSTSGGFTMRNSSTATVIADQYSPPVTFRGQGWKSMATAASQSMVLTMINAPEQGVTNPIGTLKMVYGTNSSTVTESNGIFRLEWGDNFGIGMLSSKTPQNNAVQVNGNLVLAHQDDLGTEKLTATDAGFTGSAGNWVIAGTGYAYSSNTIVKNTNGTGATLTLANASLATSMIPGEFYQLQIDVTTSATKGNFTITCGGATLRAATTNAATYTWTFMATSTASLVITDDVTTASRYTLDNVSLKKITGGELYVNGYIHKNIGTAVASADTIAPTGQIFHVTGVTTINTISLPYTGFSGSIRIIPDGIFVTGVTGNIILASTSVVNKVLTLTYDESTSKWYPSY